MKTILFCNLPYSFSILEPLAKELTKNKEAYLWFVPEFLIDVFPYKDMPFTSSIKEIEAFKSDAIFVAGNDVPYWIQGVKVQIFHGLAGEKKGHFRIRDYFDLYLTQGDYFTSKFQALAKKHQNFEVKETGWCKLDKLFTIAQETKDKKERLLKKYHAKKIILYAPTFSPSLTSAVALKETIEALAKEDDFLIILKFHDKMDKSIIDAYKSLTSKNIYFSQNKDITQDLQISDLMLSDTSSVVYEFILLDKPVITLNSHSENIEWSNHLESHKIIQEIKNTFEKDTFKENRQKTIAKYHPYTDGKSAKRMIEATKAYIEKNGVPLKRKLSLLRKFKMWRKYT